jgi:hypothetical protein
MSKSLYSAGNPIGWVTITLLAGFGQLALAGVPTDCRQRLLSAYHKLANQQADSQTANHLQFISTSLYQVPGQRAKRETTVRGDLYTQGNKVFFQTKDISLWQDGRYVATALHSQHTVLLTRMVPGQTSTDPRRILMVRDSLLVLGKLLQCSSEQQDKQQLQHIQLGYTGPVAARIRIQSMDFWLTSQNTLQRMRILYQPGNTVQQATVSFPIQERLVASDKLPTDARAQVLDERGKLLPAYQGYRLVNQLTPNH